MAGFLENMAAIMNGKRVDQGQADPRLMKERMGFDQQVAKNVDAAATAHQAKGEPVFSRHPHTGVTPHQPDPIEAAGPYGRNGGVRNGSLNLKLGRILGVGSIPMAGMSLAEAAGNPVDQAGWMAAATVPMATSAMTARDVGLTSYEIMQQMYENYRRAQEAARYADYYYTDPTDTYMY